MRCSHAGLWQFVTLDLIAVDNTAQAPYYVQLELSRSHELLTMSPRTDSPSLIKRVQAIALFLVASKLLAGLPIAFAATSSSVSAIARVSFVESNIALGAEITTTVRTMVVSTIGVTIVKTLCPPVSTLLESYSTIKSSSLPISASPHYTLKPSTATTIPRITIIASVISTIVVVIVLAFFVLCIIKRRRPKTTMVAENANERRSESRTAFTPSTWGPPSQRTRM